MRQYLLVTISALISLSSLGQDTTTFRAQVVSPQIYWDYGKTMTLWTDFEQKTEFGMSLLLFDHIELIGEYGKGKLTPREAFQNIDYTVEGSYYRLGIGYMVYIDPSNRLGLELKYGKGNFQDYGNIYYRTVSDYNPDYQRSFARNDLSASWGEFNITSQRYLILNQNQSPQAWINRLISMGVILRYRWKLNDTDIDELPDYYAIPGYGRASASNLPAINFFIKFSLL